MCPWLAQSLSNIGDLLGMRMYSTSCGTISASHKSPTKRDRRLVSMDCTPACEQWAIVAARSDRTDTHDGRRPQPRARKPHDHAAERPTARAIANAHRDAAASVRRALTAVIVQGGKPCSANLTHSSSP